MFAETQSPGPRRRPRRRMRRTEKREAEGRMKTTRRWASKESRREKIRRSRRKGKNLWRQLLEQRASRVLNFLRLGQYEKQGKATLLSILLADVPFSTGVDITFHDKTSKIVYLVQGWSHFLTG